jgi:hypothetical protein
MLLRMGIMRGMPNNTPARLALIPDLTGEDERMAGSNAGKKRNYFVRGNKDAWRADLLLSPLVEEVIDTAAEESGNYSPALYLELFIRNYVAEHGRLPAVPVALLDASEVSTTTAA